MPQIKSIRQCKNLREKNVFLRVDFNVPMNGNKIKDDYRIISTLPSIRYLARHKAKIIVATHFGRPNGKKIKKYSTKPLANYLSKKLNKKVIFASDCVGSYTKEKINKMKPGDILFLENLRYHKEEKQNDLIFAAQLASLADIYVNDAFGVCHRAQASVSAIKEYLPSYAGLLLENEIKNLDKILKPKKPLIVLIGGAKISTKIFLIKKLQKNAFKILIGGALANNFFIAKKFEIGKSLYDKEGIKLAKKIYSNKIILPVDVVAASNKSGKGKITVRRLGEVKKNEAIFDIGPETIKLYADYIKKSKTVIWNGPMGMYEIDKFKSGTKGIAISIATNTKIDNFSVVGGGETVEALKLTKMFKYIDWVSTGGGAMLSYLSGKKMPGLTKIVK